ncbi:hypothetical protein [Leptospira sp. GIMC2001]|uniref:hypothetical protein n=1 Tax=Leptospira sp. GIMC2001 TaxID=1513297 RepID=UPI002349A752|nr:hypothetical protein [Leptospira sp. GIMC2001]WCL50967.1 hypothetical protein O4O04_09190 [Leptospira sp. GIMC2001]
MSSKSFKIENLKLMGINFHSDDVTKTAQIYHEIFGWKIIALSEKHASLSIVDKPKIQLFIDKIDGNCPTNPGTLTLELSRNELENKIYKNPIWQQNFQTEYKDSKKNYESWIDANYNRIWFVYSELN